MELEKYLNPDVMYFDIAGGKADVLRRMVARLCAARKIAKPEEILECILQREEEKSTGMSKGVAIPHARTDAAEVIHLALGLSRQGIEWESADGKPAHFVFLVVGPKGVTEDYLKLVAEISRMVARAAARQALRDARTPAQVLRIMRDLKARENRT